jgi:HSP20 family protein
MALLPFRSVFDIEPSFSRDWLISDPFRDEFFAGMKSSSGSELTKPFAPLLTSDLIETETEYKVLADLPGVEPSALDLHIEKNNLVMKAERKHSHETKTDKVHSLERSYGTVQRVIRLPKNADMDKASTSFKNGVLTVTFPKLAHVAPEKRKLEIKSE